MKVKKPSLPPKPPMSLVLRPKKSPRTTRNNILPSLQNQNPNQNQKQRFNPAPPNTARPNGSYGRRPMRTRSTSPHRTNGYQALPNAPISASDALTNFSDFMTEREKIEIPNYSEIFYIRPIKPSQQVCGNYAKNANESLIDDDFFEFVKNDHIKFRYQQVSELGKGAFGSVIKCYDHKINKTVAVKLVRDSPKLHQQILLEYEVLSIIKLREESSSLHHIIKVYDLFVYRQFYVFVFELLASDMYTALKENKFKGLDLVKLQIVTRQIADSLSYIHSLGLIHCDIKPENVLWTGTRKTSIKLIDFGCCCYQNATLFTYIQSRFYRAPEVILGLPYGQEIDVWSLGCMIVEMYTGKPLFGGEDEKEQIMLFMSVLGLPPSELIADCPRKKHFFNVDDGTPIMRPNSKGRTYTVQSTSLAAILHVADPQLVSLVDRCLKWDPNERIKAKDIPAHPWFSKGVRR